MGLSSLIPSPDQFKQNQSMLAALPAPSLASPVVGSPGLPSLSAPSMPSVSPGNVLSSPATPESRILRDQTSLDNKRAEPTGGAGIHNPFLRGLARTADILGSVFEPGLAAAIPGSTLHHNMEVGRQQQYLANDQATAQQAAQTNDQNAQSEERRSLSNKADALASGDMPFTMTEAQAQAINQPGLAGTQTTGRDYTGLVKGAGNNTTATTVGAGHDAAHVTTADMHNTAVANKPMQRDDHYISVMEKPLANRTPEDNAFKQAYENYVDTTKTQPGVQRMVAGAMARPLQVVLPSGDAGYQTAGTAIKQGLKGMGDNTYKAVGSLDREMTSGQDAHTISAGQTLMHHTNLYDSAVDAVHNGNVQLLNKIGNEMGIQTGSDAQTNLNLIRQGVAMEAARYYTGGVPGEAEISQFNKSLSGDGSPAQMHGGANTIRSMATGKMQGLQGQYNAGMQGKPNFGAQAPSGAQSSGQGVSLQKAMQLPQFKGQSSAAVSAAISAQGHQVLP